MTNILGLSFGFHDSSAALVIDGEFVFGAHEERFSRKKHDHDFPIDSINFCLKSANLKIFQIDRIVFYENTSLKLDRVLKFSIADNKPDYLATVISSWLSEGFFSPEYYISKKLSFPIEKISCINHHDSHAAAAFLPSNFEEAAILINDAVGEYECSSIYKGSGNDLIKISSLSIPYSIGLVYSAYTSYLGFEVNEGEYKIMGMSAFGNPKFSEKVNKTFNMESNGELFVDSSYFDFTTPTEQMYTSKLIELFGKKPSVYDTPFFTPDYLHLAPDYLSENEMLTMGTDNQFYADIAASLQCVTEEIVLKMAQKAIRLTGLNKLCLGGGVALNSVANSVLQSELNLEDIFIQPASGDGGSALGAALHYTHCTLRIPRKKKFHSCLKGSLWSVSEIRDQIEKYTIEQYDEFGDDEFYGKLSELLIEKNVIGWFSSNSEWGPRSLGARSIIADPRYKDTQEIVNRKIKFREPYRPFAPSVMAEYAKEWFDFSGKLDLDSPESYMLSVARVKSGMALKIPAVTHVDGTARIQLVWKETNPSFHQLLKKFYERTGVPILLNTSFNLRGEPIVDSPYDAILTFSYSGMDYLALRPFIIKNFWEFGERDD